MDDETVIDFPAQSDDAAYAGNGKAASPARHVPADAGDDDDPAVAELALIPHRDAPYVAHSRPHGRGIRRLRLIPADGKGSSFSYDDLRDIEDLPPERPGLGPRLRLRFFGASDVEVDSPHCDWLHGQIEFERLAWIRALPYGWVADDDSAVVITSIRIRRVKKAEPIR
jgi:hypothetical protein